MTDEGLKSLVMGCPELSVLQIGSALVTDRGMAALADHSHQLNTLVLDGCVSITMEGVWTVVSGCPALAEVSVPRHLRKRAILAFPGSASGVKVC